MERTQSKQKRALAQLTKLYEYSAGIYLGNNPAAQQTVLAGGNEAVEATLVLQFTPEVFRFIAEGTQRFPAERMSMSPPEEKLPQNTSIQLKKLFCEERVKGSTHPCVFKVLLPKWSFEDVDLKRWILGFAGSVQVISPVEYRRKVASWAQEIIQHYQEDRTLP